MSFKFELIKYQRIVNHELKRFLSKKLGKKDDSTVKYSYDLLDEYILRSGKRLRAIAMIKVYESLTGNKDRRILLPSICAELFHASSLVHDDIMDEDDIRRNRSSMHKQYNDWFLKNFKEVHHNGSIFQKESLRFSTSAAIIQGNIMFSLGLFSITTCKFKDKLKNEAINLVQAAYRKVNEGQLMDVVSEFKSDISERDYTRMAALKTGILFATSLELGSIFADSSKKTRKLLHDFGMNIAIAFQIQDDIMDISENMKKGNTFGSDIRKGKNTILMINAFKKANKKQKKYLNRICGKPNATKQEIKEVVRIFEETGSVERAKYLAENYIKKGKICLQSLKKDLSIEGLDFFNRLSDYMANRTI